MMILKLTATTLVSCNKKDYNKYKNVHFCLFLHLFLAHFMHSCEIHIFVYVKLGQKIFARLLAREKQAKRNSIRFFSFYFLSFIFSSSKNSIFFNIMIRLFSVCLRCRKIEDFGIFYFNTNFPLSGLRNFCCY